ncbi:MAG: hypothetical protein LBQ89_06485, partial [Treponema sp.]|nr:hypothetical protein [Treponema sp.]
DQFANATELNFIIACWWRSDGEGEKINIDEFGIGGANIFVSPSTTTGNMGNYSYGYQGDGISIEYKQAVWHLPEDVLETAQENGAQLELVFNRDLTEYSPALYLVWQDNATQRWWPTDSEAGTNNENLLIINYDNGAYAVRKPGVTYDAGTKKLTIVLNNSLETYSGFSSATDVNLVLACWWGVTDSINELGIVSATIVSGDGGALLTLDNPDADIWGWKADDPPNGVGFKGKFNSTVSAQIMAGTEVWLYWEFTGEAEGGIGASYGIGTLGAQEYNAGEGGMSGIAVVPVEDIELDNGEINLNPYNNCSIVKIEVY